MKKNTVIRLFPALIIVLALSGCFSEYRGDMGTLSVSIGTGNSRLYVDQKEVARLEHEIILKGPSGTITKTITGSALVTFELVPGSWNVKIRAVSKNTEDMDGAFLELMGDPTSMLRALGWTTVDVKAGKGSTAKIDMVSATEVAGWDQLEFIVDHPSSDSSYEEIIVVKDKFYASSTINIGSGREITLIAENDDAIIYREPANDDQFFNLTTGGVLKLKTLNGAKLVLDGDGTYGAGSLIKVEDDGSILEMHEGVILQNNVGFDGGAVTVGNGWESVAFFTMYGGIIRENETISGNGGAVMLAGSGVSFSMKGGTISGNTAISSGGGVAIEDGASFSMSGGIISGNKTSYTHGGGVCVYDGAFTMTGGTISGNECGIMATSSTYGGGVYIGVGPYGGEACYFSKKGGGTIYGMEAAEGLGNFADGGYPPGKGSGKGQAVFVEAVSIASVPVRSEKALNYTAGPGMNLDANDSAW